MHELAYNTVTLYTEVVNPMKKLINFAINLTNKVEIKKIFRMKLRF